MCYFVGATIRRPLAAIGRPYMGLLFFGRRVAAPTVSTIINQMKGNASRQIGHSIWQKGFYDHVVRGDADYMEIWKYIEGNPARWKEDKLYID